MIIILNIVFIFIHIFNDTLESQIKIPDKQQKEEQLNRLITENTLINKEKTGNKEKYIKDKEKDYKFLFGNKGVRYLDSINKKINHNNKKKCEVKFLQSVQYFSY